MSQAWCTIESDPGVFTELIQRIGVKGVQVEEIYDLSDETLNALQPVHGLIFLFKWVKDDASDRNLLSGGAPGVFFAKQVVQNACATQAIISVLMNASNVDLGPELSRIKEFASALGPEMIGQVIGQDRVLRTVHNSFSRPEPFMVESDEKGTEDDDAFHFIGYVPVGNKLYELDGLQPGPIEIGDVKDGKWLEVAKPAIEKRIQKYSQKEIRFNLLAIVKNRQEVFSEEIKKLQASLSKGEGDEAKIKAGIEDYEGKINQEKQKFKKWEEENVRRKHNFVPFVFNLLKELAQNGKLDKVVEVAQKKAEARMEAAANKAKSGGKK
eukprot:CAMPEP_0197525220 /NCGR_PEP_ID=MMETSP1318-20131121/10694_1 /TAXON_ID=552666 /ORGANISM="Partenskyella glossopodia, Strain RCC365" /LENGTH=324 /DNA_ID=CAMNT_0043078415 /DNA_START=36 /DNA_END=1010 /DNA_ORIENTATION=-